MSAGEIVALAKATTFSTLHRDSGASESSVTLADLFGAGAASGPVAARANASPSDNAPAPLGNGSETALHTEAAAESDFDLAGKLTRVIPNFAAFMESSPGISDVYVPL
eukprot:1418483-Rhodomonas_salina.1